jgi:hypothetical protein
VTGGADRGAVRLAELVATLSLATDLGRGEPMEHCLRQTVIALRIGERIGIGERDRVATYYTGLLANVYCHADAHEQAESFGTTSRPSTAHMPDPTPLWVVRTTW